MNKTIALLITLDTKDQEAAFLVDEIRKLGDIPLLMDIGVIGDPGVVRISRERKFPSKVAGLFRNFCKTLRVMRHLR